MGEIDSLSSTIASMLASVDRLRESHFFLHEMEKHYHNADPLRYSLNSFLRALKEVPSMVSMELQNRNGFSAWFRTERDALRANALIATLADHRDFIVHQGMLLPKSQGEIGLIQGKHFRFAGRRGIDPLENSEQAMLRMLAENKNNKIFLAFYNDEELTPCVYREWKLKGFDKELVNLCAEAYLGTSLMMKQVMQWLGADLSEWEDGNSALLGLGCRHEEDNRYRYRHFSRKWLDDTLAHLNGSDMKTV